MYYRPAFSRVTDYGSRWPDSCAATRLGSSKYLPPHDLECCLLLLQCPVRSQLDLDGCATLSSVGYLNALLFIPRLFRVDSLILNPTSSRPEHAVEELDSPPRWHRWPGSRTRPGILR